MTGKPVILAPTSLLYPRLILFTILFTSLFLHSLISPPLSHIYSYLSTNPLYRFSGFETLETVLCYMIIEPLYTKKFAKHPELRIDLRGSTKHHQGPGRSKLPKMRRPSKRIGEIITYAAPLFAMDFVMIKKFAGVPVADIRRSGGYPPLPSLPTNTTATDNISPSFLLPTIHNFTPRSPLQLHRALPPIAPSSRRLVLELITAFFIYDALFFFIHIAFHRIKPLARVHQPHHTHAEMHPQVTNRLSVAERLSLILLANFSLNIIGSHVLTRTAFVPFFVYLLVEVHSGLDLPWSYDKIMPFGGAGSKIHAIHHRTGEGAFQPFFTWWDQGLEVIERRWFSKKPRGVFRDGRA